MAPNCSVGMCEATPFAWGMCETHYHRIRRAMIHDGVWRGSRNMDTQIACKCTTPKWDTCGPLFPTVHVCRWCGSPHPAEFGQPLTPMSLVSVDASHASAGVVRSQHT